MRIRMRRGQADGATKAAHAFVMPAERAECAAQAGPGIGVVRAERERIAAAGLRLGEIAQGVQCESEPGVRFRQVGSERQGAAIGGRRLVPALLRVADEA
jgi:hypothetical protein